MTKSDKLRVFRKILCIVMLLLLGGELLFSAMAVTAVAEGAEQHTNVLDDLEKDDNFDPADFPDKPDDYSLQVITVAEGSNGELFVYVYQPSNATKDFKASYINMALVDHTELNPDFNLYSLTWINSNGVFDKYVVNNFKVSTDEKRYYNIAALYRAWDESIDDPAESSDRLPNHLAFDVGRVWLAYYYNDQLLYESENVSTVLINPLATGSIRFQNGFEVFGTTDCDSHFLAFSIDNYEVSEIYQAKIRYIKYWSETFVNNYTGEETKEESTEEVTDYLYGDEKGSTQGYFNLNYSWDRITDADSFCSQIEDYTNAGLDVTLSGSISNADFVFQFLETDFVFSPGLLTGNGHFESTIVSEVVILELKFITNDGKTYHLGVVSDIISGDPDPDIIVDGIDNLQNQIEDYFEEAFMWLLLILGIVILIFLWPFVSSVLKILWIGFKILFKVLIWVISIPFKIIGFFLKE